MAPSSRRCLHRHFCARTAIAHNAKDYFILLLTDPSPQPVRVQVAHLFIPCTSLPLPSRQLWASVKMGRSATYSDDKMGGAG
jgi:hypothetical protein